MRTLARLLSEREFAQVLAVVQCIRYHGEKFSVIEEKQLTQYCKEVRSASANLCGETFDVLNSAVLQVVMPALNAFHLNRPACRIAALVDDFCAISAEVKVRPASNPHQVAPVVACD